MQRGQVGEVEAVRVVVEHRAPAGGIGIRAYSSAQATARCPRGASLRELRGRCCAQFGRRPSERCSDCSHGMALVATLPELVGFVIVYTVETSLQCNEFQWKSSDALTHLWFLRSFY